MTNGEWMAKEKISFREIEVEQGAASGLYKITGPSGVTINSTGKNSAHALANWLDMEHREQILNREERAYLAAIIKPFRKKVDGIAKYEIEKTERIKIYVFGDYDIELPRFAKGTMYTGMQNKEYTLEELGL